MSKSNSRIDRVKIKSFSSYDIIIQIAINSKSKIKS